jgi:hypothetical protein
MAVNPNLKRLVDLAAPYWAGEAEVVWTYFQSPTRTQETDLLWLRRQCFKEIWGSGVGDKKKGLFQGPVAYLSEVFHKIDREVDRHEVLDVIDDLRAEFFHYCLFADIYDSLSREKLDPTQLAGWESDNELARIRYEYREQRGKLGYFAVRFTEGGYCSMYAAGMRLAGTGGLGERIANACKHVYRDEIGHMRSGFVGLARQELSSTEWDEIAAMIRKILLQRIYMRNEQFSYPLSQQRINAIDAGDITPMVFDYTGLD